MVIKDLVDYLRVNFTYTKEESSYIIDGILTEIKNNIKLGNEVKLQGFGTFKPKTSKSRIGRDPRTGERVDVPAKKKVGFKVSKEFKALLNS